MNSKQPNVVSWAICSAIVFLLSVFPVAVSAHVEGTPVAEHPPKTAFGVVSQGSIREINNDRFALSVTPFAEYSPVRFLSFGAALPWGTFDGEVLLSDLQLSAKGLLPVEVLKIVPIFSVELPTGSADATSHHVELVPALFLERKFPPLHLFGRFGARFGLGGSDGHGMSRAHGGEGEVNALAPHTDRELFGTVGASYFVISGFGVDARIQLVYEALETLVPRPAAGVVYQYTASDRFTFKTSLNGYYATAGVREGAGVGLSVYISPH